MSARFIRLCKLLIFQQVSTFKILSGQYSGQPRRSYSSPTFTRGDTFLDRGIRSNWRPVRGTPYTGRGSTRSVFSTDAFGD